MHRLFRRVPATVSVSALITLVVGVALAVQLFAEVRRVEWRRPIAPAGEYLRCCVR
ncbi:hypothetical protein ACFQAT_06450 [Undibacterium arcticum]|uniref:Uncharacterized protein n=1 Tax=Undibacterium arcticum TaxID=1762892 RepID=A0ABV7F901_9BURK